MHTLNLAFTVAVNETVESGRAALDTVVVVDSFRALNNDVREEAVSCTPGDDSPYSRLPAQPPPSVSRTHNRNG